MILKSEKKSGGTDKSLHLPCRSDLEMHIRRVHYQVYIWVHAHKIRPGLPNIQDSGWKLSDGAIEYEWTKGNLIVPEHLIEYCLTNTLV